VFPRAFAASALFALLALATAVARAQEYLPSNLTAAQVYAKSEAARGGLQRGKYVLVQHSQGGGLDVTATTHIDQNDILTVERYGPFVTSYGRYGGQYWEQNQNGTVFLRSGFHAHSPNALAWSNLNATSPGVTMLGITKPEPREYAIEANPPGGDDEYDYFNATTFQLDRVVTFAKDRYKHTVEYSDYRTAFGETRPYHAHYTDGRAENDEDSTIVSFERDTGTTAMQIPATRSLFAFATGDPVTLPARFSKEGLIVHTTIAGKGFDFAVDSGSTALTIDPSAAHELGLSTYGKVVRTMGGNYDESKTIVPEMTIGAFTLHNVAFDVVPIDKVRGQSSIAGLLGCDFLASAVVAVDLAAGTVTLYPRSSFDVSMLGRVAPIPIQLDDGVPRMPGSIENVPGSFLVDTGSFTSVVYGHYLNKLSDVHLSSLYNSAITGVGGELTTKVQDVQDLRFGPFTIKNASVVVPLESTFDLPDYDAILGRNVLGFFILYFDYANNTIYFKPNNQ
jgi:Aspartyl protease